MSKMTSPAAPTTVAGVRDSAAEARQLAGAVLSRRYEEQLFCPNGGRGAAAVPVLLVTGFLGSGKTTLLQHLLATGGTALRLGVLVNEAASIDVDGPLLDAAAVNAAAGASGAGPLAGGCACCAVAGDLAAALRRLQADAAFTAIDYLLLETSGLADVQPLADSLQSCGFTLAGVVAVVDAEAAQTVLQLPVASAQLAAADVVVLNKCDLSGLGALADLEDELTQLAPGARILRARFGQVPPHALLDLSPAGPQPGVQPIQQEQQQQQQQQYAQGEIAFLSHEPTIMSTLRAAQTAGCGAVQGVSRRFDRGSANATRTRTRAAAAAAVEGHNPAQQQQDDHQQYHHHQQQQEYIPPGCSSRQSVCNSTPLSSHGHEGFGSAAFTSDQPLCMACFCTYVAHVLRPAQGLFRVKGFAWFAQARTARYVFHMSGRARVACGAEGVWKGQPQVALVLLGRDQDGAAAPTLSELADGLKACVYGCCSCTGAVGSNESSSSRGGVNNDGGGNAAAAAFAELALAHHRFELLQVEQHQLPGGNHSAAGAVAGAAAAAACGGGGGGGGAAAATTTTTTTTAGGGQALQADAGLVQFSALGSPLHGVVADEVNAGLLRRANATPGLFLCHVCSPAALAVMPGQRAAYSGVVRLQACFPQGASAAAGVAAWEAFIDAGAALLRSAYQHVHNCKCDVAGTLQLMGDAPDDRQRRSS